MLALGLFFASEALSEPFSKEEVIKKYERAIYLAEELNVYREDILHVVPKIRFAVQALLRDDFVQADRVLDRALDDLKIVEGKRPTRRQRAFKQEWLEIYLEIVQKYAVTALFAFLFVKFPLFRRMFRRERLTVVDKIYLTFTASAGALVFSFFDLARYGDSAWAFLDFQVVFLAIGGLIGGIWPGLFAGALVAAFRWSLKPAFLYVGVALLAGGVSGFLSRRIKSFQATEKMGFAAGTLVGLIHGLSVYLPLTRSLPWSYVLFSALFLALVEGIAVFIFFAVVSGFLREENRREIEQELLKTKLLFLQAQINPHFLYNALNTISAICAREQAVQAQNLILRLAEFLRGTLKRAEDKVTLREEMAHLDAYLEIEKVRFQERLRVNKISEIREELWNDVKVPFLILQPLVENAIKHGISKKSEGGVLEIKLAESNGHLKIEISDDGPGIQGGALKNILEGKFSSKEGGIGIQNVNQRLIRSFGPTYGLCYESEPTKGTKVILKIPLTFS